MKYDYVRTTSARVNEFKCQGEINDAHETLHCLLLAGFCRLFQYIPTSLSALRALLSSMPTDPQPSRWTDHTKRDLVLNISCKPL